MSFIAGYLLGLDEGSEASAYTDPRIDKLTDNKTYPPLWTGGIADGWNIRVKIASDIDNERVYQFGSTHHNIQDYNECATIYYCVYYNDDFKYAVCKNMGYYTYKENYQNADVPNRLYYISRISGFTVTSGEISYDYAASTGPTVKVEGSFLYSRTAYSWTNDSDRIEEETTSSTLSFSNSCGTFFGAVSGSRYIVKGTESDFENAVYGLYAACLKRI